MAKAYVLSKEDISDRCLRTVELIYCNHYFQRCDNTSSQIRARPVCREACEVMVQQHCKTEYRRAHFINKAIQGTKDGNHLWYFDLMDCNKLPRRNGGTIPECLFPPELEGGVFFQLYKEPNEAEPFPPFSFKQDKAGKVEYFLNCGTFLL